MGDGRLLLGCSVRRRRLWLAFGSRLLRGGRKSGGDDAQAWLSWQAAAFEAIITFGLVLMVLSLASGPKLNGPFVPLAVGAHIMA